MNRRRFAFWLGIGAFTLGEKLGLGGLDAFAASVMRRVDQERWRVHTAGPWQWYERDKFVDGQWKRSAMTRPRNVETGEWYQDDPRYIDESQVPMEMRTDLPPTRADLDAPDTGKPGEPSADRQARDGRPPSLWLRSLDAEELRIWLKTVELPEFGVEGMTFWTHLTKHHYFNPDKIEGLNHDEQAKLHAAAHMGY